MDNKAELIQNIQKNAKLVLTSTDKPVFFLQRLSQAIESTADVLTGKLPNDD